MAFTTWEFVRSALATLILSTIVVCLLIIIFTALNYMVYCNIPFQLGTLIWIPIILVAVFTGCSIVIDLFGAPMALLLGYLFKSVRQRTIHGVAYFLLEALIGAISIPGRYFVSVRRTSYNSVGGNSPIYQPPEPSFLKTLSFYAPYMIIFGFLGGVFVLSGWLYTVTLGT